MIKTQTLTQSCSKFELCSISILGTRSSTTFLNTHHDVQQFEEQYQVDRHNLHRRQRTHCFQIVQIHHLKNRKKYREQSKKNRKRNRTKTKAKIKF